MQTVMIIAAVTAGNVICFLLGGRRSRVLEKSPGVNQASGTRKILQIGRKKEPKVSDPMDVIMSNLETYDGTSFGQQEIPRG